MSVAGITGDKGGRNSLELHGKKTAGDPLSTPVSPLPSIDFHSLVQEVKPWALHMLNEKQPTAEREDLLTRCGW